MVLPYKTHSKLKRQITVIVTKEPEESPQTLK